MHFCKDSEENGWFWVDRGVDDKADHFKPCGDCASGLEALVPERNIWNEFEPCDYCSTRLEVISAILEANGDRPYIGDRGIRCQ